MIWTSYYFFIDFNINFLAFEDDLFQIFKEYTKKQWNKYPAELDASVLARLPFRLNNDDRYFSDEWQALPEKGYTHMFENMLKSPNIDVALEVDYFKVWIFIKINTD